MSQSVCGESIVTRNIFGFYIYNTKKLDQETSSRNPLGGRCFFRRGIPGSSVSLHRGSASYVL